MAAMLLTQFHVCLYGSNTSKHFGMIPPTLEEYLSQGMREADDSCDYGIQMPDDYVEDTFGPLMDMAGLSWLEQVNIILSLIYLKPFELTMTFVCFVLSLDPFLIHEFVADLFRGISVIGRL